MPTQAKTNRKIKRTTKVVSNFSIRWNNWLASISCTGSNNVSAVDQNATNANKTGKSRPSSTSSLGPITSSESTISMTPEISDNKSENSNDSKSDADKRASIRVSSHMGPSVNCHNPADKPLKSILKKHTRSPNLPSPPSSSTMSLSDSDSTMPRSPSVSFYESPEMKRRSLVRANSCGNTNTHKFKYLNTVHGHHQPLRRIQSDFAPENQFAQAQQQQLYFMRQQYLQEQYQQQMFQKFHSSNAFPAYNVSPVGAVNSASGTTNLAYFPSVQGQLLVPSVQLQF